MEGLAEILQKQTELLTLMAQQYQQPMQNQENAKIPLPGPLNVKKGDVAQNFEYFVKTWNNYIIATGIDKWPSKDEDKKVHTFITALGEEAMIKYNDFNLTSENKISCTNVISAIRNILMKKKNVIYERAMFNSANQNETETFEEYILRLQILIETCEFGTFKDDLLRDRIVLGIRNRDIRKKLMTKPELTLQQAMDICRVEEITSERMKNLDNTDNLVNKLRRKEFNSRSCLFCGGKHKFEKGLCPAFGKKCTECGGKNHFAKVCKKKDKKRNKEYLIKKKKIKEIKDDEEVSDQSSEVTENDNTDSETEIKKIRDDSYKGGAVKADLKFLIEGKQKKLICELDTGANVSIIGQRYLNNIMNNTNVKQSKHKLYSFGGNEIKVIGEKTLICLHKEKEYPINFQVVDVKHGPLLSADKCVKLGLVKFCNTIKINNLDSIEDLEKEAHRIIEKYKDVFQGYGCLENAINLEVDENITPSIQKPRRIPIHLREQLKEELDSLIKNKIIEKVDEHTEWVSNILIVQRNNKLRICLDPIPLNKALKRPNTQFTTIDEILPELGKAKIFSTVDAKKGFWQIKLSETSSNLTTFWTPFARYRWLRMPFGISPAPEIFKNKMCEILNGLEGIELLADDILIIGYGDDKKEALENHNKNLENLLIRLKAHNCKLNLDKLCLCKDKVKFYGHVLTDQGLKPDENKILAIKNFPEPKNKNDLHRFLGMITYLSRYVKNLSSEIQQLRRLLRENVEWNWSEMEKQEFENIKNLLTSNITLKYFEKNKPIVVECDASDYGLGAAVYQQDKIIGFASRTLSSTERKYAPIEKEMLAIVFACIRFDQMIVGNPQTIIKTDHRPLINIFQKPLITVPKRLQKMLMTLQRYNLNLQFVAGKENIAADALSRAPLPCSKKQNNDIILSTIYKTSEKRICKALDGIDLSKQVSVSEERLDEIRKETLVDQCLIKIKDYILTGWPNTIYELPDEVKRYNSYKYELTYQNGIIYKNQQIVIPFKLRRKILKILHTSHNGIEGTINMARRNVFWPGMSAEIRNAIKECTICTKLASSQTKQSMQTHPIPEFPFQYISMDVLTTTYKEKKTYFLITVDHYSDYFELDILKNLSSQVLIDICKQNFSRHGIPQRIITDNGTNFASEEFKTFTKKWNICHCTSSPHYPQANGKAEATVKIAKQIIKKSEMNNEDIWLNLLHHRNIPNKIGTSPVERLYSRSTRTLLPSATKNYLPMMIEDVPLKIEESRRKAKFYYDKGKKDLPKLVIGQPVVTQLNPKINKEWTPGKVQNKLSDRSYIINVEGKEYHRNAVHVKPTIGTAVVSYKYPDETTQCGHEISEMKEGQNMEEQKSEHVNVAEENESTNIHPEKVENESTYINPEKVESQENVMKSPIRSRPKRDIKLPKKLKDFLM